MPLLRRPLALVATALLLSLVPAWTSAATTDAPATDKKGCCSKHGGVCGCSDGRAKCCDGALSPTCGC